MYNAHSTSARPWLIYAPGRTWGHINRAVALARNVCATRPVIIFSDSYAVDSLHSIGYAAFPASPARWSELLLTRKIYVCQMASVPATARGRLLNQAIACFNPEVLCVDSFPRGIDQELNLPSGRNLLRVFYQPAGYLSDRFAQWVEFVRKTYPLVIVPGGEGQTAFDELPQAVVTPPWVNATNDSLWSRQAVRQKLGINPDQTAVLVVGNGAKHEHWHADSAADFLKQEHPEWAVKLCLDERSVSQYLDRFSCWPVVEWMPGFDCVVGQAGYNLLTECVTIGAPLVARPVNRTSEDQRARLQAEQTNGHRASTFGTGSMLLECVEAEVAKPWRPLPFVNGAELAARKILSTLDTLSNGK